MYTIQITKEKLQELRMLADWQLKEMGIDPISVTHAVLEMKYDQYENAHIEQDDGKGPQGTNA